MASNLYTFNQLFLVVLALYLVLFSQIGQRSVYGQSNQPAAVPAPTDAVLIVPAAQTSRLPQQQSSSNVYSAQPTYVSAPATNASPLQSLPAAAGSSPQPASGAQQPSQPLSTAQVVAATSAAVQQPLASQQVPVSQQSLQPTGIPPSGLSPTGQLRAVSSSIFLSSADSQTTRDSLLPIQSTSATIHLPSTFLSSLLSSRLPSQVPNTIGLNTPPPTTIPPGLSTFPQFLANTTPVQIGLEVWHCQILFANDFAKTLNITSAQSSAGGGAVDSVNLFTQQLGEILAKSLNVDNVRITDISVVRNPDTGGLVLKFSIRPPLSTCQLGCNTTTQEIVVSLRNRISSLAFNLTYISTISTTFYINHLPAFFAWTDKGPCPNVSCHTDSVCNCQATGEYYCQCLTGCASSNQRLWGLIVIPIVLIIILIIVFIILIRVRQIKIRSLKRKPGTTVRDYKPAYDIGTIVDQPMVATLDPGAANRLYKTLGRNLGIAFNDRSFVDSDKVSNNSTGADSTAGLVAPF